MSKRTYLLVIFAITLLLAITTGLGLIYFYPREKKSSDVTTAEEQKPVVQEQEKVQQGEPSEQPVTQTVQETPSPKPQQEIKANTEPEPESIDEIAPTVNLPDADSYYWVLIADGLTSDEKEQIKTQLKDLDVVNVQVRSENDSYEIFVGPYTVLDEAELFAARMKQISAFDDVKVKIELNR